MRAEFEVLVKEIADESCERDAGMNISSGTMLAYNRLLDSYDRTVDPVLKAMKPKDRADAQYCMNFIYDSRRTILMIRAINRAILARRKSVGGELKVIEAGMGSGLLLAATLALDAGTQCDGYDRVYGNQLVTAALIEALKYETRVTLHQANLMQLSEQPKPHILIAEHINQGLTAEHATKIPRVFDIDPDYVIPYAVIPGVYWNGIKRTDRGAKIVLADRNDSDQFYVAGTLKLPPLSMQPVATCCDVEWGAPKFGYASLLQPSSNRLKGGGWDDHLLHALWLPAKVLGGDDVLCIRNNSLLPQTVSYQVAYAIGTLAEKKPKPPSVTASGKDAQVTTVFRGRAQATELLNPVRRAWWSTFA